MWHQRWNLVLEVNWGKLQNLCRHCICTLSCATVCNRLCLWRFLTLWQFSSKTHAFCLTSGTGFHPEKWDSLHNIVKWWHCVQDVGLNPKMNKLIYLSRMNGSRWFILFFHWRIDSMPPDQPKHHIWESWNVSRRPCLSSGSMTSRTCSREQFSMLCTSVVFPNNKPESTKIE